MRKVGNLTIFKGLGLLNSFFSLTFSTGSGGSLDAVPEDDNEPAEGLR